MNVDPFMNGESFYVAAIDPASCKEHKEYIDKLCADFEIAMKDQIDRGIKEKESSKINDPLFEEIMQHTHLSVRLNVKCFMGEMKQ